MRLNLIKGVACLLLISVILMALCSCSFINETLYPINYKETIILYGDKYGIPYELLAAIIKTESNYNANAVSNAGAVGLMQLMPTTAEEVAGRLGEEYNGDMLTDPTTNIYYGSFYLKYLYDYLGENWETACAAYNAGIGNVSKWLKDANYSDDGVVLKKIPIEETANYVKRINKFKPKYKELYFTTEDESNE